MTWRIPNVLKFKMLVERLERTIWSDFYYDWMVKKKLLYMLWSPICKSARLSRSLTERGFLLIESGRFEQIGFLLDYCA